MSADFRSALMTAGSSFAERPKILEMISWFDKYVKKTKWEFAVPRS
jgi:hypothetical protein